MSIKEHTSLFFVPFDALLVNHCLMSILLERECVTSLGSLVCGECGLLISKFHDTRDQVQFQFFLISSQSLFLNIYHKASNCYHTCVVILGLEWVRQLKIKYLPWDLLDLSPFCSLWWQLRLPTAVPSFCLILFPPLSFLLVQTILRSTSAFHELMSN